MIHHVCLKIIIEFDEKNYYSINIDDFDFVVYKFKFKKMNNFFTIIIFKIHLSLKITIYKKIDEFVVIQLRQIIKIYSTF